MEWNDLLQQARTHLKGYCRVCRVCDGRACAGEVPGMGGVGSGSSFEANVAALAKIQLNMRTIHDVRNPDTSLRCFGKALSLPVLGAPITGSSYNMGGFLAEDTFIGHMVQGCVDGGTLCMTGDGADPKMFISGLEAAQQAGDQGIAIIKPRSQEMVRSCIEKAEQADVCAVGMDIDGAGLITMALKGQPVGPKSSAELKELVGATALPFVVKGIMTADEAELCVSAGVKAIVVSNHGGRVLDATPGVADVLPEIASCCKGKVTIFADGGVRSGVDVLKMLALGADAVLIGRPLIVAAYGGGREGVAMYLQRIQNELIQAMLLTGVQSVTEVSSHILKG